LKNEAARLKSRKISAAITPDVNRFFRQIKRTRFSAHTGEFYGQQHNAHCLARSRVMSFVSYRCPRTSQEVTTGIDTDAEALAKLRTLKIAVACPHCPEGHSVPADEMFFSDTASSTPAPPIVASPCSLADDGSAAHDGSAARQVAGDVVGSNN
jgi:hypothetical protein